LAAQPDHPGAQQLKDELSKRFSQSEQLYQEIDRGLNGGDLSELVALLQEAVSIYPEHPAGRLVQIKIGARARQYRGAMEEGLRALEEERWGTALECFRQALRLHHGANSLREIIEPLNKISDLRQEIHRAIAQGESGKALRLARLADLLIEKF
jgi:outer membrane protein assembly factor BamD (BamD/ComL family)